MFLLQEENKKSGVDYLITEMRTGTNLFRTL